MCSALVVHVRTTNIQIIQHAKPRHVLSSGLNQVSLKPTSIAKCIANVMNAFEQLRVILKLQSLDFSIKEAREWVHSHYLQRLKAT